MHLVNLARSERCCQLGSHSHAADKQGGGTFGTTPHWRLTAVVSVAINAAFPRSGLKRERIDQTGDALIAWPGKVETDTEHGLHSEVRRHPDANPGNNQQIIGTGKMGSGLAHLPLGKRHHRQLVKGPEERHTALRQNGAR